MGLGRSMAFEPQAPIEHYLQRQISLEQLYNLSISARLGPNADELDLARGSSNDVVMAAASKRKLCSHPGPWWIYIGA